MLLAIDVGNSNIVFGLFNGKKLVKTWRCETLKIAIPAIRAKITAVVIASVVPSVDQALTNACFKKFGVHPHFVTANNISGIRIRFRNLSEVGADRVVDALAAYKLYGGPTIVVDFGTATTFDVISAKGEYLGGAIAPGITMARDALHMKTAKLPQIELKAPRKIIGNDTVSAMQSGLVYGYAAMVEGMIGKMKSQIPSTKLQTIPKSQKSNQKIFVIATGGLASLVCKYTTVVDRIDTELILKGLRIIANDLETGWNQKE